MPHYEYRCDGCEESFEKMLPIAQYRDPQECPACGHSPATKLISGGSGFILRGDGWAGKNNRVRGQMREKNRRLDAAQAERGRDVGGRLAPNVEGERVESWGEAAKLAKSKGKNTSGYEAKARKEKK